MISKCLAVVHFIVYFSVRKCLVFISCACSLYLFDCGIVRNVFSISMYVWYVKTLTMTLSLCPLVTSPRNSFCQSESSHTSYIDAQLKDLFRQLKTGSPTTEYIIRKLGIEYGTQRNLKKNRECVSDDVILKPFVSSSFSMEAARCGPVF